MDIEQNDMWENDEEDQIGVCEKCGQITEVFTSQKDNKNYCLNGCKK